MYKEVKGTPMEARLKMQSQGELAGAGMYYALALAAREHGLEEAEKLFIECADQHAAMTGFYNLVVEQYPIDEIEFWKFVKGLSAAEVVGHESVAGLADEVEAAGFADVAEVIRTFSEQHKYHHEVDAMLLDKYAPETVRNNSMKQYVCNACGYIYEGELTNEPEDFTCPLCFSPKDVFDLKED